MLAALTRRPEAVHRPSGTGNGWRALGVLVGGLVLASLLGFLLVLAFPGSLASTGDGARLGGQPRASAGSAARRRWTSPAGRRHSCRSSVDCSARSPSSPRPGCCSGPRRTRVPLRDQEIADPDPARQRPVNGTRWATSPPAATRRPSSRPPASRRSPIGWCSAPAWPAATRSATRSRGRRRSRRGWPRPRQYAWTPAVHRRERGRCASAYVRAGSGRAAARRRGDHRRRRLRSGGSRRCAAVRQAVHRVEKAGYRCRVAGATRSCRPTELAEVAAHAEAWRDTGDERGFSMALGRLGDPADGHCVLVEALDGERASCGPCSRFVPWGAHGPLARPHAPRPRTPTTGSIEFMVVGLIEQPPPARRRADLAELRHVPGGVRGGRADRRRAGDPADPVRSCSFFSKWWQLESLYRSNAKYQPGVGAAAALLPQLAGTWPGSASRWVSPRVSSPCPTRWRALLRRG